LRDASETLDVKRLEPTRDVTRLNSSMKAKTANMQMKVHAESMMKWLERTLMGPSQPV
jgi:hypothetical protein